MQMKQLGLPYIAPLKEEEEEEEEKPLVKQNNGLYRVAQADSNRALEDFKKTLAGAPKVIFYGSWQGLWNVLMIFNRLPIPWSRRLSNPTAGLMRVKSFCAWEGSPSLVKTSDGLQTLPPHTPPPKHYPRAPRTSARSALLPAIKPTTKPRTETTSTHKALTTAFVSCCGGVKGRDSGGGDMDMKG